MFRSGAMDLGNEHVRSYMLASYPFHMPPTVQEDQPAVALDWLLHIEGRRNKAAKEPRHG